MNFGRGVPPQVRTIPEREVVFFLGRLPLSSPHAESARAFTGRRNSYSAQCAVCKVRCHCIFYGPGIRYSDIFGAPGIRYSVIIKLPCALLQTGHLETVHAPVADTVAYFADLDAPVVDTVTYFGGNHRSRV